MTRIGSAERGGVTGRGPLGGINRLIQDSRPRIKDDARAAAAGRAAGAYARGAGFGVAAVRLAAGPASPRPRQRLRGALRVTPHKPAAPSLVAPRSAGPCARSGGLPPPGAPALRGP